MGVDVSGPYLKQMLRQGRIPGRYINHYEARVETNGIGEQEQ